MKKLISLISVLFLIFMLFPLNAFAIQDIIVDDSADLFSESEEAEIEQVGKDFTNQTWYSVGVVTTNNALGKTSQEYADDYYDNLVINEEMSADGILLLIDMDNREVCISTMGACISVYEYYIDYIIDRGYNELTNGYYTDCIILMIEAAKEYAENYDEFSYDIPQEEIISEYDIYYYDYDNNYQIIANNRSLNFSNVIIPCVIIAIIIGIVSVLAVKNNYKNTGKGDEFDADDVILNLTGSNDTVISRNVITTRVPRNNNNHHRHGGGGGMSHRSSGGFSHGGGSRKF